jgi:hypothetical protein
MRCGPLRRPVSSERNPARVLLERIEDAAFERRLKLETARGPQARFLEVVDYLGFRSQSCCVNRPTAVVEMWPADPKDHTDCAYT